MNKLDKKVNLNSFIVRTIFCLLFYIGYVVLIILPKEVYGIDIVKTISLIVGGIIVFFLLIYNFVLPFFIFKYYGYELKDEHILIYKGVVFKKKTYIPIKRVQHLEKSVGPIQVLLNLSTVQVFTAGSTDFVFGLNNIVADELINDINDKLNIFLKEEEKDD